MPGKRPLAPNLKARRDRGVQLHLLAAITIQGPRLSPPCELTLPHSPA